MTAVSELSHATVAQLRLVTDEALRVSRWSLALRPLTVAGVSLLVVLHAPQNPSRYMFTTGLAVLAAWIFDAQLARRAASLGALRGRLIAGASTAVFSLPGNELPVALGWRRALLGGARLGWFLPAFIASCAITIDAQRFGADDVPGEMVWYLALLIASLGVASLGAWSWWLDRFGDDTPRAVTPGVAPSAPALAERASLPPPPLHRDDPELARWVPRHDPNERPFPDPPRVSEAPIAPRSGTTQTFATVEAEAVEGAEPGAK